MGPGQIRLVWFPFSRREVQPYKKRPVLVVNATGQTPDRAILVAMITSKPRRFTHPAPGDVPVRGWANAGLTLPSTVRARRLWTAEERDFSGSFLGTVDDPVLQAVRSEIRKLL